MEIEANEESTVATGENVEKRPGSEPGFGFWSDSLRSAAFQTKAPRALGPGASPRRGFAEIRPQLQRFSPKRGTGGRCPILLSAAEGTERDCVRKETKRFQKGNNIRQGSYAFVFSNDPFAASNHS